MNYDSILGRTASLFQTDLLNHELYLNDAVARSRFLVIGGAGSIGQAVTKEIFKKNPRLLHVVDISENNIVELVRDIRSTMGYIDGDFQTFAIDCGGKEFEALINSVGGYDYVLNLSALKHVRSEKDPFTLMRLIQVNILNTLKTINLCAQYGVKKYFCVSTDKAANPVNMMGASKKIMELFLMNESSSLEISTARFANVAFSDGSLLHGFNQRFSRGQPLTAPLGIKRYFITPQESGELCLMSTLLGKNREIFFPKITESLSLISFSDIAVRYLQALGYEPYECASESEARERAGELIASKRWPCYFFKSDTTGEKDFEEFYTHEELLDMSSFETLGVIMNSYIDNKIELDKFLFKINNLYLRGKWQKCEIVDIFMEILPTFDHKETGKYLDQRM